MPRPAWEFGLTLERGTGRPLFLQIATAIADDITRGRLRAGDALPGSRELAKSLRVNRTTVQTAYDELAAEGWIVVEHARGPRVADDLPVAAESSATGQLPTPAYELPAVPHVERWPAPEPGVILLNSWPDTRLLRTEPFARVYRRMLRKHGRRLLAYANPLGHADLRRGVAHMLATSRGLAVSADDVMITRGSQMALTLLARGLVGNGRVVAVENPGYPYAWQAFRLAGANVVPVPVDRDGMDIDALDRLAESRRIDAVYVTPHHQFPTTVTMSAARRAALLDLARRRRLLVIEDDYDDAFHFEGRPVLPLASIDTGGSVAYVGTFAKALAPGFRVGYIAAPAPVLERISVHRQFMDIHGDPVIEASLAALIDEGEVQRHLRRAHRVYRRRRDCLIDLLRALPVTFEIPGGGVALWVRVDDAVDVDAWQRAAADRGVRFLTGRVFTIDGEPMPFARLGFASADESELRLAVQRMEAALVTRHGRAAKPASGAKRLRLQ